MQWLADRDFERLCSIDPTKASLYSELWDLGVKGPTTLEELTDVLEQYKS